MPPIRPADPRQWKRDDVYTFAEDAGADEVAGVLRELLKTPDDTTIEILLTFLGARHDNTFLKPIPSQLAMRALISMGPPGIERLLAHLRSRDDLRYRSTVIETLWHLSRGRGLVDLMDRVGDQLLDLPVHPNPAELARRALQDLFADARLNLGAFSDVASFLHTAALRLVMGLAGGHDGDARRGQPSEDAVALMNLFAEGAIKLTRATLEEFADLIRRQAAEERYQEFLKAHPVLLDPLAAEIIPKQRLGIDYATDFAVRSHDDRWLLVEIEKPQDDLFTEGNDFRSGFTHAFGQVLDFQHWVDDNVAYAQKLMPQITAPRGLLVMGLRSNLTEAQQAKLRRFVDNSRRIEVVTYDDLLARATSLYENLYHRLP